MKTEILASNIESIKKAAKLLQKGEVVSFPTETVYGLGADALNPDAIKKIFDVKGRPINNPLIVHIADLEMMNKLCYISNEAKILIDNFWPGPLTLLLPKKPGIPSVVNNGLNSIAIRMPNNITALKIIRESKLAIAAPSANTSGKPSPTSANHVFNDFANKIPLIIDGGNCDVGLESTVLDMCSKPFVILRPGGISLEDIKKFFPDTLTSQYILNPLSSNSDAQSPGMMYKHYSPKAKLVLVSGTEENVINCCKNLSRYNINKGKTVKVLCFEEHVCKFEKENCISLGSKTEPNETAKLLFSILRDTDEKNIDILYSEIPQTDGIGLALMNRMLRAAGFNVINADNYILKH